MRKFYWQIIYFLALFISFSLVIGLGSLGGYAKGIKRSILVENQPSPRHFVLKNILARVDWGLRVEKANKVKAKKLANQKETREAAIRVFGEKDRTKEAPAVARK